MVANNKPMVQHGFWDQEHPETDAWSDTIWGEANTSLVEGVEEKKWDFLESEVDWTLQMFRQKCFSNA